MGYSYKQSQGTVPDEYMLSRNRLIMKIVMITQV
jgi:hypothetical protein